MHTSKVASGDNNADIGTKRVPRALFDKLTDIIIDKSLRIVNHKVNKTVMFTIRTNTSAPKYMMVRLIELKIINSTNLHLR